MDLFGHSPDERFTQDAFRLPAETRQFFATARDGLRHPVAYDGSPEWPRDVRLRTQGLADRDLLSIKTSTVLLSHKQICLEIYSYLYYVSERIDQKHVYLFQWLAANDFCSLTGE